MNLTTAIAEYEQAKQQNVAADILELMDRTTRELIASNLTSHAVQTGQTAPDFALPDQQGRTITLSDVLAKGPLVLSFYRGGWCPYCNLELRALQQALTDIKAAGATLLAVSPELPDNTVQTHDSNELNFSVLSDVGNHIARQYGLVFTLSDELKPVYEKFGLDIPVRNGDDSWELPFPATFVIQRDGSVSLAFVNADYTQRLEPQAIVDHLRG